MRIFPIFLGLSLFTGKPEFNICILIVIHDYGMYVLFGFCCFYGTYFCILRYGGIYMDTDFICSKDLFDKDSYAQFDVSKATYKACSLTTIV